MNLSFSDSLENEINVLTNMDITDSKTSDTSADEIKPEVQKIIQKNKNKTENMSNLPSTSYAEKRIRSKEDKISAILAKRSKDTKGITLSISEQNLLLATSMKKLCIEDDIDVFFKSIAMTVKKMSPKAIKEAKLRTLTLVTEIDDEYTTCQIPSYQKPSYQIPLHYNNMHKSRLSPSTSSYSGSSSSASS